MRTVAVFVALITMVRLSGQGMDNPLINSSAPGKDLIILTYYRHFLPDLESVNYLSNDKVIYATFFSSRNESALRKLKSEVKRIAELFFRIAIKKKTINDLDENEIIIPVKLAEGRSLYLFPEHRLIIDYSGRAHIFPRIKPTLITESRLSLWFSITL